MHKLNLQFDNLIYRDEMIRGHKLMRTLLHKIDVDFDFLDEVQQIESHESNMDASLILPIQHPMPTLEPSLADQHLCSLHLSKKS